MMSDLNDLLYMASEDAPPSRVDLSKIMKDGRRRRLTRRLVFSSAAVAMAIVMTGGFLLIRSPGPAPRPDVDPLLPASAPDRFSPVRLHLTAGWVPDGLIPEPPQMSQLAQRIRFAEDLLSAAGMPYGRWADVTLFAAGVTPPDMIDHGQPDLVAQLLSTDPVGGGEAVWIAFPGRVSKALAWRWAPDAWAVVRYDVLPDQNGGVGVLPADYQAVERRIAENVRTDVDAAIEVPFTMAAPGGMHLVQADQEGGRVTMQAGHAPEPYHKAVLAFRPDDLTKVTFPIDSWSLLAGPRSVGPVVVTVEWQVAQNRVKPEPDRIIDGHPAAVVGFQPGHESSVTIYDVDGYTVTVRLSGSESMTLDQATQLALSVQILGPPTDSSQWTGDPIR